MVDEPPQRRMQPYQRLVYDTARARGLSYSEVAKRAGVRPDGKPRLSRQRVQQIVKLPITSSPAANTVEALADGLGLHPDTIREAISETLGLRVMRSSLPSEMTEIMDMVEQLPEGDRVRWMRLARMLLRDMLENPSDGSGD